MFSVALWINFFKKMYQHTLIIYNNGSHLTYSYMNIIYFEHMQSSLISYYAPIQSCQITSFSQLYLSRFCIFPWCFNLFICIFSGSQKSILRSDFSLCELLVRSNLESHRDVLISFQGSSPNEAKICTRFHLLKRQHST